MMYSEDDNLYSIIDFPKILIEVGMYKVAHFIGKVMIDLGFNKDGIYYTRRADLGSPHSIDPNQGQKDNVNVNIELPRWLLTGKQIRDFIKAASADNQLKLEKFLNILNTLPLSERKKRMHWLTNKQGLFSYMASSKNPISEKFKELSTEIMSNPLMKLNALVSYYGGHFEIEKHEGNKKKLVIYVNMEISHENLEANIAEFLNVLGCNDRSTLKSIVNQLERKYANQLDALPSHVSSSTPAPLNAGANNCINQRSAEEVASLDRNKEVKLEENAGLKEIKFKKREGNNEAEIFSSSNTSYAARLKEARRNNHQRNAEEVAPLDRSKEVKVEKTVGVKAIRFKKCERNNEAKISYNSKTSYAALLKEARKNNTPGVTSARA